MAEELGLDEGYLSRILRTFKERGLIRRERSQSDGRQVLLRLTEKGQKTFAPLNARSREQAGGTLSKLHFMPGGSAFRLSPLMFS